MKTLIVTAIVLGFTMTSCKKETQTTTPTDVDTMSTADSTSMNASPMPSDTLNNTTQGTTNTMRSGVQDSATSASAPR